MRAAIYFTPESDAPLSVAAASWLGRSCYPSQDVSGERPALAGLDELAASPRRYGFHATLKAPFAFVEGKALADFDKAVAAYCEKTAPIVLPSMVIGQIGSFFALIPAAPNDALQAFAGNIVRRFDLFRAPLSDADLERRRNSGLSPAQDELLREWGYPYVFDAFRYHMTLTGPVPAERQGEVRDALLIHFAPFIGKPLTIDALAVFVEPEAGADFTVHARHELCASSQE